VVGTVFEVLDPKSENIKDPDTGKPLGSVDRVKIVVRVAILEERLAIARTFRTRQTGGSALGVVASYSKLFEPPRTVVETLKTEENTWEDLDESESFVKTGDPVREAINWQDPG
jgi:hypothetical protein